MEQKGNVFSRTLGGVRYALGVKSGKELSLKRDETNRKEGIMQHGFSTYRNPLIKWCLVFVMALGMGAFLQANVQAAGLPGLTYA